MPTMKSTMARTTAERKKRARFSNLTGIRVSGYGFEDKGFEPGNRFEHLVAQIIAALQIARVINTEPHLAVDVLPRQRLERKIDCRERRSEHDGRAALRIAEDEQLGWRHGEPN